MRFPARAPSRREFLQHGVAGIAALANGACSPLRAMNAPRLTFSHATLPDPDGHHAALLLKGDWLVVGISDGRYTGLGEISHSKDDPQCLRRARELFDTHIASPTARVELEPASIAALDRGAFASAADLVTATAISGLNQALLDLTAQRTGVPVWRLFRTSGAPVRSEIPCYLTLNRALRGRAITDYLRTVEAARALGVEAVKMAPFEKVDRNANRLPDADDGFARLEAVRREFPQLSLRVDCHERFTLESTLRLLPRFEALRLDWLEEPCPPGSALGQLRRATTLPLAVGELFFGEERFRELLQKGWADVIMPDPKHVGGFNALVRVCQMAESLSGQVSPHNPSGPIAACAAIQAAALSPAVTSTEFILTSDPARQPCRELLHQGRLRVPTAPGWGVPDELRQRIRTASR